jgi:DnaD and phage-associated domain
LEAETGYNRETLEKLIKRFEEYGKIIYSKETREIIILNWLKYNFINSKNTICCINKELKSVKNKGFINLLYKNCLTKGYDVEAIFKDIPLAVVEDKAEAVPEELKVEIDENKIEDSNLGGQTIDVDSTAEEVSSDFIDDGIKKQSLPRGFEGAYKDLGEKEEEKEIQKEASNKQKVINKTEGADAFCSHGANFSCRVLMEFNKNIRQATIRDLEKLGEWKRDFEEEIIIQAIYEAVKYKARHTGYINSVLKSWKSAGITKMEEFVEYREGGSKKNEKCNAGAYRYLD